MKILLVTIDYPPFVGGVSNYYYNIVKNWPQKEDIFVLHNNDNKLIRKWLYPQWLIAFFSLWKEIKKNKINHILVGHILPLGTVTYYLTKILKVEYTVILHGMDIAYACKNKRKKNMSMKILKKAKNIVCVNSYAKKFVIENFCDVDKNKIKIVNPGIDIDIQIDEKIKERILKNHKSKHEFIVFSVSRLVKRKGFDKVILAIKNLQMPNLKYFIAGTGGDEDYLKDLAKNNSQIIFLGHINEKEKWAWLSACDIFVMPSRNIDGDVEGFGIVYLEAGLQAKAVIAGKSGGIGDAVIHEKTGLLVDPCDLKSIEKAICKLANDNKHRNKLGINSQKRIKKNFKWKNKANDLYDLLENP